MKVLIVEDDSASRKVLTDSVKSLGFEAQAAEDGEMGWEMFQTLNPDLVISDIRMPRMDGLDLLNAIRHQNDKTIVIIITAYGCEKYAMEALRRKANNFLTKPILAEELHPMLKKYAAILKHPKKRRAGFGNFIRREFTIQFPNRFTEVPLMTTRIISEVETLIPHEFRLSIHLGLAELIANAIEHGNLEISHEEKKAANGRDPWYEMDKIMSDRLKNPHMAKRRVTVHGKFTPSLAEWLIEDEGQGFDWRAWPMDIGEFTSDKIIGRGIFLSRCAFDSLEFLGRGNRVRVTKNLHVFESAKEV